jgi:hypothetical protein
MLRVTIRVQDHLDDDWAKWLDGFSLTHTEPDETILTGKVKDQAALYGLIAKLRDLGVSLIAVNIRAIEDDSPEEGLRTV